MTTNMGKPWSTWSNMGNLRRSDTRPDTNSSCSERVAEQQHMRNSPTESALTLDLGRSVWTGKCLALSGQHLWSAYSFRTGKPSVCIRLWGMCLQQNSRPHGMQKCRESGNLRTGPFLNIPLDLLLGPSQQTLAFPLEEPFFINEPAVQFKIFSTPVGTKG